MLFGPMTHQSQRRSWQITLNDVQSLNIYLRDMLGVPRVG
jgi:hypothetical protein